MQFDKLDQFQIGAFDFLCASLTHFRVHLKSMGAIDYHLGIVVWLPGRDTYSSLGHVSLNPARFGLKGLHGDKELKVQP